MIRMIQDILGVHIITTSCTHYFFVIIVLLLKIIISQIIPFEDIFIFQKISSIQKKVRHKQQIPVLSFVLWNIVNDILCPWYLLVSYLCDLSTAVPNWRSLMQKFEQGFKGP